jgi:hypothetical protein
VIIHGPDRQHSSALPAEQDSKPRSKARNKNNDTRVYVFFLAAAALAFAAFFLLLRIITMPRNEPTTAEPRSVRMTGMRMAQTRGGKKSWSGWPLSTNGYCGGQ